MIGSTTFKKADLCAHTWKYKSPGCAFTSENLLAKAGGEIAAKKVEEKLSTYYQKAGFSSSNTYFKFNEDGTFNAKIDGKSWSGTYTFDEKTHAIDLKGRLLLSLNGFATKNSSGISILFESKKLLTIIQTLTALSGNTTLGTIGEISKTMMASALVSISANKRSESKIDYWIKNRRIGDSKSQSTWSHISLIL